MSLFDFDDAFRKYLESKYASESKKPTIGRYWPSQLGYCLRRQYYRFRNPKPTNPDSFRFFERGHVFHRWVADVLANTPGLKVLASERSLSIVDFKTDPPFTLDGRLDDLILVEEQDTGQRILIEVKSTETPFSMLEKPSRAHVLQIMPYLLSQHADVCCLLYLHPNLASKTFTIPYDKAAMVELMARGRLLDSCLRVGEPPVAEARMDPKSDWECKKRCEYVEECSKNEK